MSQRRNDDNFRNQQQGGRSNWDQAGGQPGAHRSSSDQDQHSQYSGNPRSQYGGEPFSGREPGNPYGNPYDPSHLGDQPAFGPSGGERDWGPVGGQDRFQERQDYRERQFGDHYGAVGDPYRRADAQRGWTPEPHRSHYGSRGFGATGHGAGSYSGLGAFDAGPRSDNRQFDQQQFDQFGREQLGRGGEFPQRTSQHDPHYRQWREEQLRRFDDDYHQWNQERYQSFANDFNDWRSNRQSQSTQGQAGDVSAQQDQNKGGGKSHK